MRNFLSGSGQQKLPPLVSLRVELRTMNQFQPTEGVSPEVAEAIAEAQRVAGALRENIGKVVLIP